MKNFAFEVSVKLGLSFEPVFQQKQPTKKRSTKSPVLIQYSIPEPGLQSTRTSTEVSEPELADSQTRPDWEHPFQQQITEHPGRFSIFWVLVSSEPVGIHTQQLKRIAFRWDSHFHLLAGGSGQIILITAVHFRIIQICYFTSLPVNVTIISFNA